MFRIFKKSQKKKSDNGQIDYKGVEALLDTIDLSQEIPSLKFYTELFDVFTASMFDVSDDKHLKALEEFKTVMAELVPEYNEIIASKFDKEVMNGFLGKFEEISKKDYELPGLLPMIVIFWYRPILKTKEDLHKGGNQKLTDSFMEFHDKIKRSFEIILGTPSIQHSPNQ